MYKFNPSEQNQYVYITLESCVITNFCLKQTQDVFQNKFTNDKIMVKSLREMQACNLKQCSRMAAIAVNVMYTR